jgi:hypothetical protein
MKPKFIGFSQVRVTTTFHVHHSRERQRTDTGSSQFDAEHQSINRPQRHSQSIQMRAREEFELNQTHI